MKINTTQLKQVFCRKSPAIAEDERFYLVENADNFAFSTYGRLYNLKAHKQVIPTFIPHIGEAYPICWNTGETSVISIEHLIALVFFGGKKDIRFGQPYFSDEKKRWRIEDLHLLCGKKQYVEYLLSKIRHREAKYAKSKKHHEYVGGMNLTRSQASRIYQNAKGRALRENTKKSKPHYANTTMAQNLIENPNEFYSWLLNSQYYHPLGLELDKDIMSFGESNTYEIGKMALVPRYINDFFRETNSELGYRIRLVNKNGKKSFVLRNNDNVKIECDTYDEALQVGRKNKAEKIRDMVEKEKKDGYIPSYILKAMSKWATLCEKGKIKMWEPDAKTKRKMRRISNEK